MCKAGHGSSNEPSVRLVQAAPVLASDRQLDEMVRNTTDTQFTCLGVDPTFKLGAFCVTPIVFPLRMLVTKPHGKSPIYLGPMFIHQTQKFSAYHFFASQLVSLRPQLSNVKAIGTDGEAALFDTFLTHSQKLSIYVASHISKETFKKSYVTSIFLKKRQKRL